MITPKQYVVDPEKRKNYKLHPIAHPKISVWGSVVKSWGSVVNVWGSVVKPWGSVVSEKPECLENKGFAALLKTPTYILI